MDIASLFREFGYPALVTGVLLFGYMRLKDAIVALTLRLQHNTQVVEELRKEIERMRQESKDG